jgi:hypothetical protein
VTCPTEYEASRILNVDLSIPRILTAIRGVFPFSVSLLLLFFGGEGDMAAQAAVSESLVLE